MSARARQITRMIGGEFGSVLTFAVDSQASAPGQIPIEDLRTVLRVMDKANWTAS